MIKKVWVDHQYYAQKGEFFLSTRNSSEDQEISEECLKERFSKLTLGDLGMM